MLNLARLQGSYVHIPLVFLFSLAKKTQYYEPVFGLRLSLSYPMLWMVQCSLLIQLKEIKIKVCELYFKQEQVIK